MNTGSISYSDFGLIGYPLGHSFSKRFFTDLFEQDGSGRSYENFEIPELTPEALYRIVMLNPKLKGFNVTAPYKQEIMQYLDRTDALAAEVGAVNTVKIIRSDDGRVKALEGFNTDVVGFRESVLSMLEDCRPAGALILGTGGASRAVAVALNSLGIEATFVSRRKRSDGCILYQDIDSATITACPLIVNATPAGTYPDTDSCPPFPYELLGPANYCHDLVYNPQETLFMKKCAAQGAAVKNGLEMLVGQAIAALRIWTSKI